MANEKAVIRFRCYQCGKLLGTSPAKAGKTTTCPNCQAELIVPEPDEPAKAALAEATRALVPDLDDSPRPRASEADDPPRHDPQFSWEEIDTAIFQAPGGPAPIDLPISFGPPEPSPSPEPEVPAETPPVEPIPPPVDEAPPTAPDAVPAIAV